MHQTTSSGFRCAAANAVGRLSATNSDAVIEELFRRIAEDEGAMMPMALLAGLSREGVVPDFAEDLVEQLSTHMSARVQRRARTLHERHQEGR
ncbi:MAG: hypothetical protein ACRDWA_08585 [Acidimicrobiia bacterium]